MCRLMVFPPPPSDSEGTQGNEQCVLTLSHESVDVGANGSSGRIQVETGSGCAWNVATGIEWLDVDGAKEGVGPGAISYRVARNHSPIPRTAAIGIGGRIFSITQQGSQGLARR
jgi:hypothetical protein